MLDEIAFFFLSRTFAGRHSDHAFAAATLGAKCADRCALDKPAVSDADDATLVANQILHRDLALVRYQLCQARGSVFVMNLVEFFFNDGENALLFRMDI